MLERPEQSIIYKKIGFSVMLVSNKFHAKIVELEVKRLRYFFFRFFLIYSAILLYGGGLVYGKSCKVFLNQNIFFITIKNSFLNITLNLIFTSISQL
jgi:hypothetical protein